MPEPRRARFRTGLALAACLSAGSAAAHPHVFIDGGANPVFDAEGRITALQVTWIYDPFTSLYMAEELGLPSDPDTPLSAEERASLARYQTEWAEGFEGDSDLTRDATPAALSGPLEADAEISEGRVVIRFLRRVETPFRPAPEAEIAVYDPSYYTAYAITDAPEAEGNAAGCSLTLESFEPTQDLAALQQSLFDIPADEDPDQDLGGLFADRIEIRCD